MTAELEGSVTGMFEWSEAFIERGEKRGEKRERIKAIKVMLKLGLTKEQILTEYTKEEVDKAEKSMEQKDIDKPEGSMKQKDM